MFSLSEVLPGFLGTCNESFSVHRSVFLPISYTSLLSVSLFDSKLVVTFLRT